MKHEMNFYEMAEKDPAGQLGIEQAVFRLLILRAVRYALSGSGLAQQRRNRLPQPHLDKHSFSKKLIVIVRKFFVVFNPKTLSNAAMRNNPLRLISVVVGLVLLLVCGAALLWFLRLPSQAARKHWKNEALPAIARWAEDSTWRAKEMMILTNRTIDRRVLEEGWLTDKMILAGSGEWLVYMSHCSKAKPHNVKDIFLAKGSDGKWYYSTFHFCVGMVGLRGEQETQPPDLKMFVHEYNLREFDGQSDECLKETKTWPASWDEKKPK